LSVIDYYPGESLVHRLDPRVKLIALIVVTVTIFLLSNFFVITAFFVGCLLCWHIAGLPLNKVKGFLKFLLSLFAFLTVIQSLFLPGEHYLFKGFFSLEGAIFGLLLSFRLLTLVCFMPLVIMTTPINKLALGLVKMSLIIMRINAASSTISILLATLHTPI
jgi:energy-coupling factor transport system permease protein